MKLSLCTLFEIKGVIARYLRFKTCGFKQHYLGQTDSAYYKLHEVPLNYISLAFISENTWLYAPSPPQLYLELYSYAEN